MFFFSFLKKLNKNLSFALLLFAEASTHPSFFHLSLWVLLPVISNCLTSTVLIAVALFCCVVAHPAQAGCVRRATWERRGEAVPPSLQTACWGSRFLCYLRSLTHEPFITYLAHSVVCSCFRLCHSGYGSESNGADEHPEQNHWKA